MTDVYEDRQLICKDCTKPFVWSAGEQKFFHDKGFTNEPVRCVDCRKKAKKKREGPTLYPVRCRICGETAMVPAEPVDPNDVLCENCLVKALKDSNTVDLS